MSAACRGAERFDGLLFLLVTIRDWTGDSFGDKRRRVALTVDGAARATDFENPTL